MEKVEQDDSKQTGILAQLQNFNKSSLKQTETAITTEDGIKLLETHDSCGNYKSTVTNKETYGFVLDECLDFQVGEILPGLILGSQDVAAEWDILDQYGVTHVLNAASYVKNFFPDKICYENIELNDEIKARILPLFPVCFKFIDEGRKAGCVLVHCNAGRSRGASICIGYLMKTEGMSYIEAYNHLRSKRPSADPNAGFKFQLEILYTEKLKEEQQGK